ncbi:MAG: acyl-CoA synthetase [Planctomycetota bacterium]
MTELPIISRAMAHGNAVAISTGHGQFTYRELVGKSAAVAGTLLASSPSQLGIVTALLAPPGADYVAGQWGVWRAGGIFLPLCLSATPPEWEYALADSGARTVLAHADLAPGIAPVCQKLGVKLVIMNESPASSPPSLPAIDTGRPAMMLYTSGTTNKPKGVVTTHDNIRAQVESLVEAWEWSPADRIPLFLPLHHIHGIINILCCALWTGASVEVFGKFDANAVLNRVAEGAYTLFMAVPTIYVRLLETLEAPQAKDREARIAGFRNMRLMVSGSAALPATVFEQWRSMTGQALLERYGMTEIGMAISNPFRGERRPGAVGVPLPGVEARLVAEDGSVIGSEHSLGEIQVRGPGVFASYWNRTEATAESFDNGWFKTGDMAVLEQGYYRILGRQSVDIIKSGGYKLSALEIESVLLEHPAIKECAVVGLPDPTWGEAVGAAIVCDPRDSLEINQLRDWCRTRMSVYKIPKCLVLTEQLPRNAMGKVAKPKVADLFTNHGSQKISDDNKAILYN